MCECLPPLTSLENRKPIKMKGKHIISRLTVKTTSHGRTSTGMKYAAVAYDVNVDQLAIMNYALRLPSRSSRCISVSSSTMNVWSTLDVDGDGEHLTACSGTTFATSAEVSSL